MNEVETQLFTFSRDPARPFRLRCGDDLSPVTIAYESYGRLSPKRDNAILLFHALSGSQHAAGYNRRVESSGDLWTEECRFGWWNDFIGPGRALDTDKFFVVCANYLGGCYGSTGPSCVDPATDRPYGGNFPRVSLSDIVDSQLRLLDHLGVKRLRAAVGSSLGGMLAINLAVRYPDRVATVIPIAAAARVSILQRIHNFEQIYAVTKDPDFKEGNYYGGRPPDRGLLLARMISHKTFVSLETMADRARYEVRQPPEPLEPYLLTHPVESYLFHQAKKFVKRFDANTYLRILDAWQNFDLAASAGCSSRMEALARCRRQDYLIFSIDSDVCFYPEEQEKLVKELTAAGVTCRHITVHSEKGHDAFLLEPDLFTPHISFALLG